MLALPLLALLACGQAPEVQDLVDLIDEEDAVADVEIEAAIADRSRTTDELRVLAEVIRERSDRLFRRDRAQAIAVFLGFSAAKLTTAREERDDFAAFVGLNVAFDLLYAGQRAGPVKPPPAARRWEDRCRSFAIDSLRRGHDPKDELGESSDVAFSGRERLRRERSARALLRARSSFERARALECAAVPASSGSHAEDR